MPESELQPLKLYGSLVSYFTGKLEDYADELLWCNKNLDSGVNRGLNPPFAGKAKMIH